jgi:hypothetical protein
LVAFKKRRIDDAVLAYRPLRGGFDISDREQVARALDHLTSRRTVRLARATCSDLLATGNLRLISDAARRDRIVKLYQANERWTIVLDRNNRVPADQMYMSYMMDVGFVGLRPDSNILLMVAPRGEIAKRLAMPARIA